jgi:hypothetical protein
VSQSSGAEIIAQLAIGRESPNAARTGRIALDDDSNTRRQSQLGDE